MGADNDLSSIHKVSYTTETLVSVWIIFRRNPQLQQVFGVLVNSCEILQQSPRVAVSSESYCKGDTCSFHDVHYNFLTQNK